MNLSEFPELETSRLVLRQLLESDWEMIKYLRSDPEVNRFVNRPKAETKAAAIEFISKITFLTGTGQSYYWCITERNHSKMIGSICLWNLSEDRKKAEVGYDLSPEFHGKGIMDEALKCVLDLAFHKLKMQKVEAYTHRDNERSVSLLKRNEFILNQYKKDPENLLYANYELIR